MYERTILLKWSNWENLQILAMFLSNMAVTEHQGVANEKTEHYETG